MTTLSASDDKQIDGTTHAGRSPQPVDPDRLPRRCSGFLCAWARDPTVGQLCARGLDGAFFSRAPWNPKRRKDSRDQVDGAVADHRGDDQGHRGIEPVPVAGNHDDRATGGEAGSAAAPEDVNRGRCPATCRTRTPADDAPPPGVESPPPVTLGHRNALWHATCTGLGFSRGAGLAIGTGRIGRLESLPM